MYGIAFYWNFCLVHWPFIQLHDMIQLYAYMCVSWNFDYTNSLQNKTLQCKTSHKKFIELESNTDPLCCHLKIVPCTSLCRLWKEWICYKLNAKTRIFPMSTKYIYHFRESSQTLVLLPFQYVWENHLGKWLKMKIFVWCCFHI